MAAYAARAGLESFVFMPSDTPMVNRYEAVLYGAKTFLIDGLINDCGRIVGEGKATMGWFDMSTLKEPYRIEGKKTMGLELAEQMGWTLPDVILYPTGGGTGLIGMWKAFQELEELGWIGSSRPRMVAVQSSGCAPLVTAFQEGRDESDYWPGAATLAAGIRVPKALGDFLILRAIRESRGSAVSVTDGEIQEAVREVGIHEGVLMCPEGAACWAALKALRDRGEVGLEEQVVLFNTASGNKYPEVNAGLV
jgi:threonine synthase